MTLEEQLRDIIEKEGEPEIIPFLKNLDVKQRKELVPHIKTLATEFFNFNKVTVGNTTDWKQKATDAQRIIFGLTFFVCYNQKDFESSHYWSVFNEKLIPDVLSWYCPPWFEKFINSQTKRDVIPLYLNYEFVMQLNEIGVLNPVPELIAKVLPGAIFDRQSNFTIPNPQNLGRYKITLEEHVWLLFNYESDVYWRDHYYSYDPTIKKEEAGWIATLKRCSDEGKIERIRLLKESILATTRNFNKISTGWFCDLFAKLEPTQPELLAMQHELFIALNSPHSKAVNEVLKCFKKIADKAGFDVELFRDHISLLVSSEVKSIVLAAIAVSEKIAKKNPEIKNELCMNICQVYLHGNEELQTRAAGFIKKFGDRESAEIQDALAPYEQALKESARELLKDYLDAGNTDHTNDEDEAVPIDEEPVISDGNKIPEINTIDDLVFLASQAFDNNESYHFDLLPAALIKLQDEIKGDNIQKLIPAFQRAYKLVTNDFRTNMGYLDHMLATFFIDFGRMLMRDFPAQTKELRIHHVVIYKDTNIRGQFLLSGWHMHSDEIFCNPQKKLLLNFLETLNNRTHKPPLSTPTHLPGWIDPMVLVKRIHRYQDSKLLLDATDMQVAMARCSMQNTAEALKYAEAHLQGEVGQLMAYFFNPGAKPKTGVQFGVIWDAASLVKSHGSIGESFIKRGEYHLPAYFFNGIPDWKCFIEKYDNKEYDFQARKYITTVAYRKKLSISLSEQDTNESFSFKNLIGKLRPAKKFYGRLIYESLKFKQTLYIDYANDTRRLILLSPNNTEMILMQLTNACLDESNITSEPKKKMVNTALAAIYDIEKPIRYFGHLFIATCMLSSDKTARTYAGEIWIKNAAKGDINSSLIGDMIGKIQSIEFAPMKRFTDLAVESMYRISRQHNIELQKMFESILSGLPDAPVKDTKKLLELYNEILALNKAKVENDILKSKLNVWQNAKNLEKVVRLVGEKVEG